MKQKLLIFVLSICFRIFSVLPVLPNVMIFESQYGKRYDDNPKAIFEYLSNQSEYNYKMFWSINYKKRNIVKNENIQVLYRFSLRWLYYMARAKFWVINARLPKWMPKRIDTKYVQTWHGTPLKKLALDMDVIGMPEANLENYKRNFLNETQKWDYLVTPNEYSKEIFKSCFAFEKTFLETGYPRNDVLYKKNNKVDIEQIKKKMGLPLNKKVILYAPTWRDDYYIKKGVYKLKIAFNLQRLEKLLDDDAVFIFRAHYLVADNFLELKGKKNIYNFSNETDINELYLISDLLITDYSSVFFDYANLERPMMFYTYDIKHYRNNLRGFYFDIEKNAPGPLIEKENDFFLCLKEFLETGTFIKYEEKLESFKKQYCGWENGNSSKKVIEYLIEDNKK